MLGWLVRLALGAAALLAALALIAAAQVATIDVNALATQAPAQTALMRQRVREAAEQGRTLTIRHTWVPYEHISPHLRRAVLVAEDDAFYTHSGLDWNEIRESARRDLSAGRIARGGSTITQQLAKNLWLGSERSFTRKFKEMILAVRLERALSKKRIFELYLNEIEWGDGVFGAEAAARRWFHTSAAGLDARASVRLAAVIINPRRYSPVDAPRRIERRARMIASRLRRRGELSADDYRAVLGLPAQAEAPAVEPVAPDEAPDANGAVPDSSTAPR